MRRILFQALAILALAGGFGTAVHLLRSDRQAKIKFVGSYLNPYRIKEQRLDPRHEVLPTPPEAIAKASTTSLVPVSPPVSPEEKKNAEEKENDREPFVDPDGIIREIEIDEAFEFWQDRITFLDARRTRYFEAGHIARARAMSVWEGDFDDKFTTFINEAEFGEIYVVYCMSKNCEDSHMLAERLKGAGFTSIMVFRGGFPEWQKAAKPIETGAEEPPEE